MSELVITVDFTIDETRPSTPYLISIWVDSDSIDRERERKLLGTKRKFVEEWFASQDWQAGSDYIVDLDRFVSIDWYFFRTKSMAMVFKLAVA